MKLLGYAWNSCWCGCKVNPANSCGIGRIWREENNGVLCAVLALVLELLFWWRRWLQIGMLDKKKGYIILDWNKDQDFLWSKCQSWPSVLPPCLQYQGPRQMQYPADQLCLYHSVLPWMAHLGLVLHTGIDVPSLLLISCLMHLAEAPLEPAVLSLASQPRPSLLLSSTNEHWHSISFI